MELSLSWQCETVTCTLVPCNISSLQACTLYSTGSITFLETVTTIMLSVLVVASVVAVSVL